MAGCLSRVGLSSTPGDYLVPILVFLCHMATTLIFGAAVAISLLPRTSGSSVGTFLVAGREGRLFLLWGCTKG